jgi:hypothetical protein
MKRQTKLQKFNDLANAIGQIRRGEKVKRIGAKDGSIRTHPVVPVNPKKLEHEVLADCLAWLKKYHVFCNRHDCGSGDIVGAGMATYGIRSAGDIIGILNKHRHVGRHFEIECKRGSGGRLSAGQQKRMKDVRKNGGIYLVVHGIEELAHYFKDLI